MPKIDDFCGKLQKFFCEYFAKPIKVRKKRHPSNGIEGTNFKPYGKNKTLS